MRVVVPTRRWWTSRELHTVVTAKYNAECHDHLAQTEELVHFAQTVELDTRGPRLFGLDVLAHVVAEKPRIVTCRCFNCGKVGRNSADYRGKQNQNGYRDVKSNSWYAGQVNDVVNYTKSVQDSKDHQQLWVLNSGSSRRLVSNESLLEDTRECADQHLLADGGTDMRRSSA